MRCLKITYTRIVLEGGKPTFVLISWASIWQTLAVHDLFHVIDVFRCCGQILIAILSDQDIIFSETHQRCEVLQKGKEVSYLQFGLRQHPNICSIHPH